MMSRALSVSRIHTVAWPLLLAWPLGILVIAFIIPWAIFALVQADEANFTGSVSALLGVMLAFYISAITQTFPFALGLSVTRKDYFAGTLLVSAVQVLVFGIFLWLMELIEDATGGWGVKMVMFGIPGYFTDSRLLQLATYLAIMVMVAGLGLFLGAIQQRWRVTGLYSVLAAVLVFFGAGSILVTWQQWWPSIGSWFVDSPRVVPMVGLPLVIGVVTLVAAWAALRRSTA
ncbi:MAG: ABC transporter permease [Rhodococcus sp.]|nr:ABC transporter permease [Rhodococcus sp. (in: high G+C Gram-positive bacteria)]